MLASKCSTHAPQAEQRQKLEDANFAGVKSSEMISSVFSSLSERVTRGVGARISYWGK